MNPQKPFIKKRYFAIFIDRISNVKFLFDKEVL